MKASVAAGARVLTGGKKLDRDGYFYAPTVLADIPPDAPAASDELFGPVASVFKAKDLNDAISIANGTSFGLGASAWTRDAAERDRFIAEIESGSAVHQRHGRFRSRGFRLAASRIRDSAASSESSASANS